jgi:carbamoylphosphate synthase large subunit
MRIDATERDLAEKMKKALILGEYKIHRLLPALRDRGVDEVVVYSAIDVDGIDGVSAIHRLGLDWDVNDVLAVLEAEQPDVAIANPYAHGQEQLPIVYGEAAAKWDGRLLAHPAEFARVACDKVTLHETAVARGWPVPDGAVCADAAEVGDAVRRLGFPVVVKEAQAQAGDGRFHLGSAEDLDAVLGDGLAFPAIVQKFEQGVEFGVELISTGGAHVHWPMVSMGPLDAGLNPSLRARVAPVVLPAKAQASLARVIHDIQDDFAPSGPWQIDFAVVDGDLRILEINPRLGGLSDMGSLGSETDAHGVLVSVAMGGSLPTIVPRRVTVELPSTEIPGDMPAPPADASVLRVIAREPTNRCFINTDRMQLVAAVTDQAAARDWARELGDAGLLRCPTQTAYDRLAQGFAAFEDKEDWPCEF